MSSAAGRTFDEAKRLMAKAIEMRLAALREDGDEIPEPSLVELVDVAWQPGFGVN